MKKRSFAWLLCLVLAAASVVIFASTLRNFKQSTIVVEWETASELDTVGFDVLRGESEDGPFTQVNDQFIPPSSDPLTGGEYAFEDRFGEAGKTYYYYLEEIESDGSRNRHGPVIQKARNTAWLNLLVAGILLISAAAYAWQLWKSPLYAGNQ